jgi:hypothetical protein
VRQQVEHDSIDPGRQLRIAAEVGDPAVNAQEHFLRKVFDTRRIDRAARHHAEDEVLVAVHELAKRLFIALLAACDERLVGRIGHSAA